MRGCIDMGSFYYYDNIFAGDTIINSINESEKLNISGIILSDNIIKALKNRESEIVKILIRDYTDNYIVPLNNCTEEYENLIRWEIDLKDFVSYFDLKQLIFEAFHAHKKDVNMSMMDKINNTEKIRVVRKLKFPNNFL